MITAFQALGPWRPGAFGGRLGATLGVAVCLSSFLLLHACQKSGNPYHKRQPIPRVTPPDLLVTPEWLVSRQAHGEVHLVDVRSSSAYARGHLPGATRIDLPSGCIAAGIACLQRTLGELGFSGRESLVLYGGRRGDTERLGYLFWVLEWAGFKDVKILRGGISAWPARRWPLVSVSAARPPRVFEVPANPMAVADSEWIAAHYGRQGIEILDLRDDGVWMDRKYATPSVFAGGHIPHALPYDFRSWISRRGRWPSPEDSWRRLRELGPRAETYIDLEAEMVLYAEEPGSLRPGLGYLLLRLMGARARVFAGGWQAWSSEPDRPVVRIVEAPELAVSLGLRNPGLVPERTRPVGLLLDLRERVDFREAHLPGAHCLPEHLFAEAVESVVAKNRPGTRREEVPLILYCYGRDCIRSREAASTAARFGFNDIWWFREGVEGWTAAGLPLASLPPRETSKWSQPGSGETDLAPARGVHGLALAAGGRMR